MMKHFTIMFTALATIALVSNTSFAATPYYQPNQSQARHYNSSSYRNWNDYDSFHSRDDLNRYRNFSNYDYQPNRRSNYFRCGTAPSYFPSYYRTNYGSFPHNGNRFDHRFDYGHRYNLYQRDYNYGRYDWRADR
ncbi:hypothetical protein [Gimesia aquarii]|nr:hypothetical protein [Gimesia aquarii]